MEFNLENFCKECFISDITLFLDKITKLYDILKEENLKHNLTRVISYDDFIYKHFVDSLYIVKFFPLIANQKIKILDLGCGAGFPSLILALAFDNLEITALDSIDKKINFVKKVKLMLDISNITPYKGRGRELNRQKQWQTQFDIITARAVSETKNIFRESHNMLKKDGQYILYKTPNAIKKELPDIIKITAKKSFTWGTTPIFNLPHNLGERQFIFSEKGNSATLGLTKK